MSVPVRGALIKNVSGLEGGGALEVTGVQRVSAAIAGTLMNSISRYMLMAGEDFCGAGARLARDEPGSESSEGTGFRRNSRYQR